ncbi:MAG: class I SAM-dependent methyltransferase [Chloroflexi bacterium CFX7]|nr:MAG: class I SAM-dependent methyltransferase [bacterium]MCE7928341.1 class I SAM-dependent methyltransferase [Chloroflexi bacterium CFX7]MCK6563232.1 class I SAM-dependent methyltransferase [Dehalococcoidia bacterium]MCL4232812.1 methyltransferase domain-containing protein [Dehalococcoidia bacterium]RIL02402.1 MAG: SAM-dependent methyltransferase [bacterium]
MSKQSPGVQVWEPLAAGYEGWFGTAQGAFVASQQLAALDRALAGATPGEAVEIGAGTGFIARALAGRGWRVEAIEPCAAMRAEGEARTGELAIAWREGSAEALPFPPGSFDLALFFAVLEFVDDPAWALGEALRVLRPGGRLVAGILDARSPWAALYRHLADRGEPPWTAARFYVPADMERLAGQSAEGCEGAVFMAPDAAAPFAEADAAGLRAGNHPSLSILSWRKPS